MRKHSRGLIAVSLFIHASTALAASVVLEWDPSTDPDLAGYKVYYQADHAAEPFRGTEAANGPAPLTLGLDTTYTVTGLDTDRDYYFAVTAYNSAGIESIYSNIVKIPWSPHLQYPADKQTDVPLSFDFVWRAAVAPEGTTYTIYYGTDPNLLVSAAQIRQKQDSSTSGGPLAPAATAALTIALLGAAATLGARERATGLRLVPAGATLALALTFAGCGARLIVDTGPAPGAPTQVLVDLRDTTAHTTGWQPNTTYYWKVVARAGDQTFESHTASFTTGR